MRIHVLLLAVLLVPAVHAGESDANESKVIEKPIVADTPDAFAKQSDWIENEMKEGGRYEFATPANKQRVHVLLGQMSNLLQRSGSVAAMDESTRVTLFNNQEEVNGILTQRLEPAFQKISRSDEHPANPLLHVRSTEQTRQDEVGPDEFNGFNRCGVVAGGAHLRQTRITPHEQVRSPRVRCREH
jgi:hypothetical protein